MARSEQSRVYRWSFILVAIIMIIILAGAYWKGIMLQQHGGLVDTDSFMHMVKAQQLAEGQDWYDMAIHGSNFPYGDEMHWTRLFDIVLLAGAYALKPFIGFKNGLLLWGIIVGPILGICSLLGLTWASRPILNDDAQRWLWLIFISQTMLLQVFYFGRPDHHSLLLLLFIIIIGCLLKVNTPTCTDRYVIMCAMLVSLAMWVSVEAILFVLVAFVTLWFWWLSRGGAYARQPLQFSISVLMFSTIFLLVERPLSAVMTVEYDKISVVYIFVLILAVAATYVMFLMKNTRLIIKLVTTLLLMGGCIGAIWSVFPSLLKGPMVGLNPDLVPIWYSKVIEAQPVWRLDIQIQIIIWGSAALFVIYLIYLAFRKQDSADMQALSPLLIGFIILLPAGVAQLRTCYFLLVVIIIVLARLVDTLMLKITEMNLGKYSTPLVRVAVLMGFMLGLPGIGLMTASASDSSGIIGSGKISQPDLAEMSNFLNDYKIEHPPAKTILTSIDFGPEIFYRTGLNIIAGPYHRNDEGILYVHNVMAAEELDIVKRMLDDRSIDLVMLCPDSSEALLYADTADKASFYERLIAGEVPDFLEKVGLPPDLSQSFVLLKVRR